MKNAKSKRKAVKSDAIDDVSRATLYMALQEARQLQGRVNALEMRINTYRDALVKVADLLLTLKSLNEIQSAKIALLAHQVAGR